MSEDERLAKAKQKLVDMNKKVQRAKVISEKHHIYKNEEPQPTIPRQKQESPSSDYLFELTETLINLEIFTEDEVTEYVKKVEKLAKLTDSELENNEKKNRTALKKINKSIQFLNDPSHGQQTTPKTVKQKDQTEELQESESKPNQGPSYSDIAKGRQSPMPRKVSMPVTPTKETVSQTPSKIPKPTKKKTPKNDKIQATGAGAKFLASLADDLN